MRALYFAAVLSALTGALVACSDDDSDDDDVAQNDGGGRDAGGNDAGGRDAATDAGLDAKVPLDGSLLDGSLLDATLATGADAWVVFPNPYGDGGLNPASNVSGSARATRTDTGVRIQLALSGLVPSRTYGAHVHKLSCSDMAAGGHYQHNPAPADASANDPAYANAANEIWLDFTANASGGASVDKSVSFVPRTGEAKAVVIHDRATGDGGVAGPKLACLDLVY